MLLTLTLVHSVLKMSSSLTSKCRRNNLTQILPRHLILRHSATIIRREYSEIPRRLSAVNPQSGIRLSKASRDKDFHGSVSPVCHPGPRCGMGHRSR